MALVNERLVFRENSLDQSKNSLGQGLV
jgi:hypothetical protein